MDNPLISVILPVHNGEDFLAQAIESILNQDYKNFELIIINDNSTDKTAEIISQYVAQDPRIQTYYNQENQKLPKSLNIGHQRASGKIITWTSDDNILKVNFLSSLLDVITKSDADLVYSGFDVINSNGEITRIQQAKESFEVIFWPVVGASFLYKKEVFDMIQGYNPNMFLVEDFDFWLRASAQFKFVNSQANLYQYRRHAGSLTSSLYDSPERATLFQEAIQSMFLNFGKIMDLNEITSMFLSDLHLSNPRFLIKYLEHKNVIWEDLEEITAFHQMSSKSIYSEFYGRMRRAWITNVSLLNRKTLLQVLKGDRRILFVRGVSKKTTLYLIKQCLLK